MAHATRNADRGRRTGSRAASPPHSFEELRIAEERRIADAPETDLIRLVGFGCWLAMMFLFGGLMAVLFNLILIMLGGK